MNTDMLVGLGFSQAVAEAQGQTPTGSALINKYKSVLMAREASFGLVNQFVTEASRCRYDNGVVKLLESVSEYIQENRISWAIASACENIFENGSSRNYLDRQAATQASKLLEMKEDEVKNYIKAGALKNVMYCEAFRNIAKQVYRESPVVEANAQYTVTHPVSVVENVGDGLCFEVRGKLFKSDAGGHVQESQWNEVSNSFRTIARLLESSIASTDGEKLVVEWNGLKWTIAKRDEIIAESRTGVQRTMNVAEFRDDMRITLASLPPRARTSAADVMESVAIAADMYDQVAVMDNVSIYKTAGDEFMVIESGSDLYAASISSRTGAPWAINENAIDVLSFIESRTKVKAEEYGKNVREALEKADEASRKSIEEKLRKDETAFLKERVAALTEAFKNDPTKLAVLSQVAQQIVSLEEDAKEE